MIVHSGFRGPFAICLLTAGLFGQETAPAGADVVIRSTTSLVQVRVVAEDAHGKPVMDLKREDFRIEDSHKPQPITLFVTDRGTGSDSDAESNAAASAANGVEPAGYALIVLDWSNTKYSDRVQSKDLLIRLLKNYQPRQRVALYLIGHDPHLVLDFTSDRDALIQAVEDAGLEPADLGDDTPGRFDARFGSPGGRKASVEEQLLHLHNRIIGTLQAFQDIAASLGRVPGRKSLIWLSSGFPMVVGPQAIPGARPAEFVFHQEIDKVLERLNRSDVAVYAVDARGLPVNTKGYPDTLQEFAGRTGGTAFLNRNDLDEGFHLALEDMRMSYILGFHVPEKAVSGVHEIRVTVNRPGVILRHRQSYRVQ